MGPRHGACPASRVKRQEHNYEAQAEIKDRRMAPHSEAGSDSGIQLCGAVTGVAVMILGDLQQGLRLAVPFSFSLRNTFFS